MKWTVCLHPRDGRLGFGGRDEPSREAATSETRLHPEALQLAAVAPRPSADAGHDRAGVAHEDRQLDLVADSHGRGRLTTDLRFEDLEVERIRIVLDVELHSDGFVQAPTICSISERSSKYVRNDRIFPSRKSATVAPASWTCRPVGSNTASSVRTSGPV